MRVEHSVEIERPVQQVFDFVSDWDNSRRWIDTLVEVRITSDRRQGEGTTFEQVFEEQGRRREARGEVLAYEPPRRLAIRLQGDGFAADVQYGFEDRGDRTRLTQVSDVRLEGLLARLMQPLIRRGSHRQLVRYYDNLKRFLESPEPADP